MSELYENNWVALGMLGIGAILAIIGVVGYTFNPELFTSFSLVIVTVIVSIASYMVYNILRIYQEIRKANKNEYSS